MYYGAIIRNKMEEKPHIGNCDAAVSHKCYKRTVRLKGWKAFFYHVNDLISHFSLSLVTF